VALVAKPKTSRPVLTALAALLVAALSATGCVSMPTGGPVQSYPVTQGPAAQDQPYVQIVPQPPGAGWSPTQIVEGFLTASASFGNYSQVARQYLAPPLRKTWNPYWSAVVYGTGPTPTGTVYSPPATKNPTTATVQITGNRQATLQGNGSYSVASSSSSSAESLAPQPNFTLSKANGQWRISAAPPELLLTSDSFANDYQLRNLYFFDPTQKYLVADPVYVPLRATQADLMNGLVSDLIAQPDDWLSGGATNTAFPKGTKISEVTLNGVTAVVNLTGSAITATAKAGPEVMEQVSAQLLSTLSSAAQSGSADQGVQSVEVELNGKPWIPPGAQGNPVQRTDTAKWNQAPGASPQFYYVDNQGYLTTRTGTAGKPVSLAKIGTGYSQVAVSPDGLYVAALRGTTLYTGLVNGALTKRSGSYVTMSWDVSDDLWASQGDQIVEFRTASARQPLGQMVAVSVPAATSDAQFTALQVAPDGVRVAIVIQGAELTFGAISGQNGPSPQIALSLVQSSPVSASMFTGLTWYGPDNVITLAEPGPAVTEYPVSGGAPTSIPADQGMRTITASSGQSLIAGLSGGHMVADASLTGSWIPLDYDGISPTYAGGSGLGGS
jgi:Lipoprotein LpqB beta-propeller domain/Sporulation and spore germination